MESQELLLCLQDKCNLQGSCLSAVSPLPVPAPSDIQISAQGSYTNSGYSATMEELKVLLGMLDAHKPDLDANLSWLYAAMQVFMP